MNDCNGEKCGAYPCICNTCFEVDIPDPMPTQPQLPSPLRRDHETEPAPSPGECYACGRAFPDKSSTSTTPHPASIPPPTPIADMTNEEVEREVFSLLAEAQLDERRVTLYMLRRFVALGQRCYGALNIASDKRNGLREVNEELGDAIFYVTLAALREEIRQR